MGRRKVVTLGLAVMCVVSTAATGIAGAAETRTHVFDPLLSLTGDCSISPVDEVPDPGCPGGLHPPAPLSAPKSIAIDSYGDTYVASYGTFTTTGAEGRIDVFNSEGVFVTEVLDDNGPSSIAVDSEGNLYVSEYGPAGNRISRYAPSLYAPATGDIEYGAAPVVVAENNPPGWGIAVDSLNGHLFADYGAHIAEFGSAAEGNPLLNESIGIGLLPEGELLRSQWVTIDAARKLIYISNSDSSCHNSKVLVLEAEAPYGLVRTIDGSTTPAGRFLSTCAHISIAVDEANGHVFIDDMERTAKVYEFTESGEYISTITHSFQYVYLSQIAMDNGVNSPNGALNAYGRYLFVPSNESGVGHSFAFAPLREGPPNVELRPSDGVTETEAQLHGKVNANGAPTHYRFEYVTAQQFAESGFSGALVGSEGTLPGETIPSEVSASLVGLAPGATYHFRLLAKNSQGEGEERGSFATFAATPPFAPCSNEALRTGLSAALPDCRAYELVSPPDTGGRPLYDPEANGAGDRFGTLTASPTGDSVAFMTVGGAIPGTEAAGAFSGSPYVATRQDGVGWSLESVGLSGAQSSAPQPGGMSAEHRYAVATATEAGSLPLEGRPTRYLRHPDGSFHLLGQGSLGSEPAAKAKFLAPNGAHAIFVTETQAGIPARRLEPQSPPAGTTAIYDRTPDEVTHVVSLLPGDVTPAAAQNAVYEGASAQGNAVAFKLQPLESSPLYLRLNDAETLEAAPAGATFAGLSADGRYAFYLSGGDLFRYDAQANASLRITSGGDATVVNIPATGAGAYFVSPSKLSSQANPNGERALAGAQNLYLWSGGVIRFVARVTERDVAGELTNEGGFQTDGLGLWAAALAENKTAKDPSRVTPDGSVLLFESRANLTSYNAGGHAEVYRLDTAANALSCLSCSPIGAPASSDASLQSVNPRGNFERPQPTSEFALVPDLSANGRRAFFETSDALVPVDTDGVQDVYEWEADGEGSCTSANGCVYLISSGHSSRDNYLYGVSESGNDVFISTTDLLVGADHDETPSIYDARVNGGFPETAEEECQGEGCRPILTPAPTLLAPASPSTGASGNVYRCSHGKHRVKRKGKAVCVAAHKRRHRKHGEHHRTHKHPAKHGRRAGR